VLEEDAAMPRIVTASHPSEADLLNLAAGREAEGLEACRKHLEDGCRLCAVRLSELAELVESVREEQAFDAILEAEDLPAIPEFGGRTLQFQKPVPQLDEIYLLAQNADPLAEGLIAAARESDAKLDAALRALWGNPSRGFALLYACQKGNALVAQDPLRALELARAVFEEAKSLMDANTEVRLNTPAPRESVQAEAKLLESQAQNMLGHSMEARLAAIDARELFRAGGDVGFGTALSDYYEGSAASFAKDYVASERLLKKALKVFSEFGQDNLMGRAEVALATLYLQRGDGARSLSYFDHAIELFDPVEDVRFLTAAHVNRAMALTRLGRLDEARASYARALNFARKLESQAHIAAIRSGLAQVDMQRAEYARALRAFEELSRDEKAAGWHQQAFFTDLFVAECLGRLGRDEEMGDVVLTLRTEQKRNPFAPSPAIEELFACLDQGLLDADLVAHVRSYLEDEANGVQKIYQPLRLAS
jgi:tetratricopeptide (TPR) repeat protein